MNRDGKLATNRSYPDTTRVCASSFRLKNGGAQITPTPASVGRCVIRSGWGDGLRFGGNARSDLYLQFALTLSKESGASYFAQAYIPTQPAQAIEGARISHAHEDPGRQESNFPPARQGAQAGLGETRFPRIIQCRSERSSRDPAAVPFPVGRGCYVTPISSVCTSWGGVTFRHP